MLFLPPNLLIQDPGQQKIAERSGTTMQGNLYVFEELRDGFLPNLNGYHANTAASKVGKNTIGFGCRAVRYYRRPAQKAAEGDKPEIDHWNDTLMLLGQQGIIRDISDDGLRALVRFQGARIKRDKDNQPVLDDEGDPTYLQEWVPAPFLRAGYRKWGSWEDVIVTSSSRIAKVSMEDVDAVNGNDGVFTKAVKVFLQTIVASKLPWVPLKFYELVGEEGENIGSVTQQIMDRLVPKVRGELNSPGFTMKDLLGMMEKIDGKTPATDSGVYVRTYWDAYHNLIEALYVGRTSSFPGRYYQYENQSHGISGKRHVSLIKKANEAGHNDMYAIWSMSGDVDVGLQCLAEQVFMSLLQSYDQTVMWWGKKFNTTVTSDVLDDLDSPELKQSIDKNTQIKHMLEAYNDMQKIGEQAIQVSGFQGGVLMPSFGVKTGLNVSTPLQEMAKLDPSVWIRQDGFIRDPATGELIEVANFTLAKPRKCSHSAKRNLVLVTYWVSPAAYNMASGKYSVTMTSLAPKDKLNGYDYPNEGVPLHITFQVRLDGKRHSHSWARLSRIGAFADWERASSFACMVRWQDPKGQWRRRWVQSQYSNLIDSRAPGSWRPYSTAIALLRWFLCERRDENDKRNWIPTFPSRPIEMITYDYLAQRRFIQRVPRDIPPPTGTTSQRYHPQSMLAQLMTIPGIQNVNVSRKNARTSNFPIGQVRNRCDGCSTITSQTCSAGEDDLVCEFCANSLGLPCCSYTPGMFAVNALSRVPKNATPADWTLSKNMRLYLIQDDAADGEAAETEDPGFEAITLHDDVAAIARHNELNEIEDENEDEDEMEE